MKNKLLAAMMVIAGICSLINTGAQDRCGTKTPPTAYRVDSAMMEHSRTVASSYMMKIFVHVIADNNGTNRAVADTSVMRQLENMRQFYAPQDICFMLMGIDQINSTDLNSHDDDHERSELYPYVIPGVMNIFIHDTLFNDDGALNGVAGGIPSNFLSVARYAIESTDNRATTAHEMGHCFGLYHTFERNYGEEYIDRQGNCTNCYIAGDLLCDTEADPHSDSYDTGNHITDCEFSDHSKFQYCGGETYHYQMDPHNIMAYGDRTCRDLFTNGQGGRARSIIANEPLLIAATASNQITFNSNATYTSGSPIFAAKGSIIINASSFVVSNSAKAVFASAALVDVKGSAQFLPNSSGSTDFRVSALCQ